MVSKKKQDLGFDYKRSLQYQIIERLKNKIRDQTSYWSQASSAVIDSFLGDYLSSLKIAYRVLLRKPDSTASSRFKTGKKRG